MFAALSSGAPALALYPSRASRRLLRTQRGTPTSRAAGPQFLQPRTGPSRGPHRSLDVAPQQYKARELGAWKEGQPLDNVPKGSWWEVFDDADLNELEAQALGANQELKAAVARADTELATTEADAASLRRRRTELENAIAILIGRNPAAFQLAPTGTNNWNPQPPDIPAGLPADLLERRPDVAEAERRLASANARIGVAKAAFFPVLTLTGSGGYLSGEVDTLFNWESRAWSIGPSLWLPIFAGGRNRANYQRSQAAYRESVALYRQQILVAFGEVENNLAAIHHLADQAAAQQRAVASARRAADLATDRYRSGIVSYLEVVDASREALQSERANAQLSGQRFIAAIQFIKAAGGGWGDQQLFADAKANPEAQASTRKSE